MSMDFIMSTRHTFGNNYESRILFLHSYKYLSCTDTEKGT